jgi:hypothetical protein
LFFRPHFTPYYCSSNHAAPAAQQIKNQNDHRNQEQQVDKTPGDMKSESQEPQDD